MNALELRGLTKHYKDFTLGPLDLTLPGGTICGLTVSYTHLRAHET